MESFLHTILLLSHLTVFSWHHQVNEK